MASLISQTVTTLEVRETAVEAEAQKQAAKKQREQVLHQRKRAEKEVARIMDRYDDDQNQTLQPEEIKHMLTDLSTQHGFGHVSQKSVNFVMQLADTDGDGNIDRSELVGAITAWKTYQSLKGFIDASFDKYDADGNGLLDREELKCLLFDLSGGHEPLDEEVDGILVSSATWKSSRRLLFKGKEAQGGGGLDAGEDTAVPEAEAKVARATYIPGQTGGGDEVNRASPREEKEGGGFGGGGSSTSSTPSGGRLGSASDGSKKADMERDAVATAGDGGSASKVQKAVSFKRGGPRDIVEQIATPTNPRQVMLPVGIHRQDALAIIMAWYVDKDRASGQQGKADAGGRDDRGGDSGCCVLL